MIQHPHATLHTAPDVPQAKIPAPAALHVVHDSKETDLAAAERAAGQFLHALGISTDSESMRGTPGRMARAYAELFSPRPFELTSQMGCVPLLLLDACRSVRVLVSPPCPLAVPRGQP
ncbi:hypothetical protein [Streptomyces sp.]|uniref:hypothetical protein n=1 Tax=Streptomyces sp. TaxID=1931 RepID=UPI0039C8D226